MTPEGHPEKFNIGTPWHTQDAFEAAMKYQSPVEIIQGELETKIENDIMTAVQRYGIRVDKEELIKALQYDRKQYEQGYEDARRAFKRPNGVWAYIDGIPCCPFCKKIAHFNDFEGFELSDFCRKCGAELNQPKEEETE